jgi:hypothetical protein
LLSKLLLHFRTELQQGKHVEHLGILLERLDEVTAVRLLLLLLLLLLKHLLLKLELAHILFVSVVFGSICLVKLSLLLLV